MKVGLVPNIPELCAMNTHTHDHTGHLATAGTGLGCTFLIHGA